MIYPADKTAITKVKVALKIFKELDLIVPNIDGDIVTVSRGGNYYSKCNLEDSKIYLKETVKE